MLSDKQLADNRANAPEPTGPKTESGKIRSRLNAARHGLTGQVVVLPREDMEAFNRFATDIVESFEPANANESQLAYSYASYQWRINRAAAIEDNMFTLGIMEEVAENLNIDHPEAHNAISNAKTFRTDAREFDRLSVYNQRLVNQADTVLKQLKQFQSERRERHKSEMPEAASLYMFHKMQNAVFDPEQNGFDLTIDQIKTYLCRQSLMAQANNASKAA